MPLIDAEPYEFAFDPAEAALLIIDMQRDFLEPGGFGESLGNDVSLLRRTIAPTRRLLDAARAAVAGDRGFRRDGPAPGARRAGPRHHPRALPANGRAGDRQAGEGRL